MQNLIELLEKNQVYLCKATLNYAKLHGYTKYTSTLEEAWVASIDGLSNALIKAIQLNPDIPEIKVDCNFDNEIFSFGTIEAKKHRERGVPLEMFLSLMKYYRQSYLDLVRESVADPDKQEFYQLWIHRFFDHTEISYCSEWLTISEDMKLIELQNTNRNLTNEKNKYLTIFESMPTPAVILDTENYCTNINFAAQQLLQEKTQTAGKAYYSNPSSKPSLKEKAPWIYEDFMEFYESNLLEAEVEKEYESPTLGTKNLLIKFHRMMDVSYKFEGTVLLLDDLTERKKIEEQLRNLSFHDALTGLYNRTYMEEAFIRLSSGRFNPVGFISLDVDGLKLVNDNLGHIAGDNLLVTVSEIITSCFREADIIVRTGGDEFAIIMFLSTTRAVKTMCSRLRSKIDVHNRTAPENPVSISIGWSVGDLGAHRTIKQTMKEADEKMYQDKHLRHEAYAALFFQNLEIYGHEMFQ